jgi:hypothetical protein
MSLLTKAINGLDSIVDVENVRSKSSMAIVGIVKGQAALMDDKNQRRAYSETASMPQP